VSCLVRVYTDSHHSGHNKMIFAVSFLHVINNKTLTLKCLTDDQFLLLITHSFERRDADISFL